MNATVALLPETRDTAADAPFEPEFSIVVDTSLYPREAVLRTCYTFTDRCRVWMVKVGDEQLSIGFRRLQQDLDQEELKGGFANALIDSALRIEIEEKTCDVRTAIVSAALAEAAAVPLKRG